ncbi:guanylate kinase [Fusarium sp. NRRL 52700]|nr:guanylate kinase [Fusarium sp. NRRL 52700]
MEASNWQLPTHKLSKVQPDTRPIIVSGPSGVGKGTLIHVNYYGTSKRALATLMDKGLTPLLDIEMEGVKTLQGSNLEARYVFLKPPSLEILETRLRYRGTEDEASISKRLAQARLELEFAETGAHDIIIVNDDLDKAYRRLEDFAFQR